MAKTVTNKAAKGKSKVTIKKVTEVRNSSIPPKAGVAKATSMTMRTVTHEAIAKRAYEIYASGKGGSQTDNWLRAERELRAGL